jgi:hypothetical protein
LVIRKFITMANNLADDNLNDLPEGCGGNPNPGAGTNTQ